MAKSELHRRKFLARLGAIISGSFLFGTSQAQLSKTPKAIEGPYYPKPRMRVKDTDNDLVKVEGVVTEAGGEIVFLKGKVVDKSGDPIKGARVEIWQCDMNGKYLSTRDRQKIKHDVAFQGFGHDITNEMGEYSFRTIKPAKYPGRTEHIHVKVFQGKKKVLTTQFYVAGGIHNEGDWIYDRLSSDEVKAVLMKFENRDGVPETFMNIVVLASLN